MVRLPLVRSTITPKHATPPAEKPEGRRRSRREAATAGARQKNIFKKLYDIFRQKIIQFLHKNNIAFGKKAVPLRKKQTSHTQFV
jgi:hypothetical protein